MQKEKKKKALTQASKQAMAVFCNIDLRDRICLKQKKSIFLFIIIMAYEKKEEEEISRGKGRRK